MPRALAALVTFALAPSSHAANVQVNFSGGSGSPLTITLPRSVAFTVTNDTPSNNAVFVFQGVGNFVGGVAAATGSLSYTTNGGSPLAINSAGTIALGVVTANDLSLFKQASPSVGAGDVLLLSSGSVTTSANITAAAPPSGLYAAIFVDVNGTQLGVGSLPGDFDNDGDVDGEDFLVWQRNVGNPAGTLLNDTAGGAIGVAQLNLWKSNLAPSLAPSSAAVPEPTAWALALTAAVTFRRRSRRA